MAATEAMVLPGWRATHRGKVRDLYEPDGPHPLGDVLLMVASDRISAFDWVLPTEIPGKGEVLTAMTLWWFERLADLVPNHVVSLDVPPAVAGRAMICRRLEMFPVECVARGYLTGSGLAEYRDSGAVCGVPLPAGLVDGSRLPEPIFTPATKAEVGDHDENIDFETMAVEVGAADAERLRELTLACYERARDIALTSGIVLADTKFEFGRLDGAIVLGDEALTPDSSRFWDSARWRPGQGQPSFDKQYVRDWLAHDSGWDPRGGTPPPELPPDVVAATQQRYREAWQKLTGEGAAV